MIPESFAYTLDPKNGAGILNVAFAHAFDALCYALNSDVADLVSTLESRRKSAQVIETGATVAMQTPDQIAVTGRMRSGPVVSAHFRGGMSRATNFRLEINGTRGDLVLTSTLGYPGVGDTTVQGGQDEDVAIGTLTVPDSYRPHGPNLGIAQNVANNYARLALDLRNQTHTAANFATAVELHRIIDAIEKSSKTGTRKAI